MKVFWSWQSDHPGRISRHFVRETFELAIQQINESPEIDEAQRNVTLDHDRKGVPGSPDLANTILEKIKATDVFVADVTPVGQTAAKRPKKLMNANVAIELGYALGAVGNDRLIMVMNEHFGARADLPFDLQHKAGPIFYGLSPTATNDELNQVRKRLVGELKQALRDILPTLTMPATAHKPVPSIDGDPSLFFDPIKPLVSRGGSSSGDVQQEFKMVDEARLYLRVIPTTLMPELRRADALDHIRGGTCRLMPLYYRDVGSSYEANEYGAIAFVANYEDCEILAAAQLFLTGEIWGFNASLLAPDDRDRKTIKTLSVEQTFAVTLPTYVQFVQEKLHVGPPFEIEAGAHGVKGYPIMMPRGFDNTWGPIQQENVCWRGRLASASPADVDTALLNIFKAFFDAAGMRRPKDLYGFPGTTPGTIPKG